MRITLNKGTILIQNLHLGPEKANELHCIVMFHKLCVDTITVHYDIINSLRLIEQVCTLFPFNQIIRH